MRFLVLVLTLGCSGFVLAQTVPAVPRTAERDLQQLQQDFDQRRIESEIDEMRLKAQPEAASVPLHSVPSSEASFEFHLSGITHDKSTVLTEQEILKAVSPWIGKTISAADLSQILNAIINQIAK